MGKYLQWLCALACTGGLGCSAQGNDESAAGLGSTAEALCVEQRLTVASATASSVELSSTPAGAAVDGVATTRWSSAFSDPQWIRLDLGSSRYVSRVLLNWEAAASRSYQLQISDDDVTWRPLFAETAGNGGIDDLRNLNASGRYLRVYSTQRTTQWGVSLWEVEVYGDPTPSCASTPSCSDGIKNGSETDVDCGGTCSPCAVGRTCAVSSDCSTNVCTAGLCAEPTTSCNQLRLDTFGATASTIETAQYPAPAAVDRNLGTRWSSTFADPQWLQVNLGSAVYIDRVVLRWEAAASSRYELQVSDDASSWQTICTGGAEGDLVDDISGLAAAGRYLRVYSNARKTAWGVSLWEVEVYGDTNPDCSSTPSCSDSVKNGDESDVDCGGTCEKCGLGASCNVAQDCSSGVCSAGLCAEPTTSCSADRLSASAAAASSVETSQYPATAAIDTNLATRWSSTFTDPQWLRIDLGAARYLERVVLRWEAARSSRFDLQVSDDASTWRTVYSGSAESDLVDDLSGLATTGRYLRLYSHTRATAWGVSLFEVEVYGDANPNCSATNTSDDLIESDILSRWSANSSDAPPATNELSVLSGSDAVKGQSALRLASTSGFDAWVRYDAPAPIDVGTREELRLSVRALNTTPYGWQMNGPVVVLRDANGAELRYEPSSQQLPTDGNTWRNLKIPLAGNATWQATGSANLAAISSIELHADTWDSGFRLDVDGLWFASSTCSGPAQPIALQASARATTAQLSWTAVAGARGYHVYRRSGSGAAVFVNRALGTRFDDSGLALGTAYQYEVRSVSGDDCENGSGSATVTTRSTSAGLTRVPTLEVLVPIYTQDSPSYTAAEVSEIRAGIDLARQFYYRNTRGKLNLNLHYLEIASPTPPTSGYSIADVEADLLARGIVADQFDGLYIVGRNLGGCYGGFVVLGRTAAAFGTACGVDYPTNQAGVNTTMTWVFTHEFQHALDLAIAKAPGDDMIHGHPDYVYGDTTYTGPVVDGGEHFDWQRAVLRAFPGYDRLAAPHDGYIEVDDADGDGLASADARLPADEQRFGSRSDLNDTDSDGLNDLAEYHAGMFAAANPTSADSDGDGQRDGIDPTPREAIAASIAARTPVIDGVLDSGYTLFRAGVEFSNVSGFSPKSYLAYDANYLYVFIEQTQTASVLLLVDGSGTSGFWHGDDTYSFSIQPGLSAVQNHTSRHGTQEAGVSLTSSTVSTRTVGGITYVEARIPRGNLGQGFGYTGSSTTGFSTAVGSKLGIRLSFSQIAGEGSLFGLPSAHQNEHYHFDDVELR